MQRSGSLWEGFFSSSFGEISILFFHSDFPWGGLKMNNKNTVFEFKLISFDSFERRWRWSVRWASNDDGNLSILTAQRTIKWTAWTLANSTWVLMQCGGAQRNLVSDSERGQRRFDGNAQFERVVKQFTSIESEYWQFAQNRLPSAGATLSVFAHKRWIHFGRSKISGDASEKWWSKHTCHNKVSHAIFMIGFISNETKGLLHSPRS